MRRINLLIILFIASGFALHAQSTSKIRGLIKDENGKAVSAATITLLKASDSSLVKMTVSEQAGAYEFTDIKEGNYLVAASSVGFAKGYTSKFFFNGNQAVEIPAIQLVTSNKDMTGVVVQASRPLVENKIDKMVVNVDASPTNAGATAMEVLEKSPGISVDRDGNISLKGKQGIIVLMDGKQTYLSGADLANLLRNMPASQLDQIEIMTQPSAKFDASGNSGIINLRTKKSLQRGFNGSVNLSYVQGRYAKSPNSFSFNYRAGKLNLFSNLSYSYWTGFNDQTLLRTFRNNANEVTSVFDQVAKQKNTSHNYSARIGLDYTIDKKTTIGFLVNGIYNPRTWENRGRANILDNKGTLDSFNTVFSENRDQWKNFGGNLNFRRVLSG